MNTLAKKRLDPVLDAVRKHPYAIAALICIFVEVFTLADQKYIAPQSIMTAAFLCGLSAYFLIVGHTGKHRVLTAVGCAVISLGGGIAFSLTEIKGGLVAAVVLLCTVIGFAYIYMKKQMTPSNVTALILFAGFGMYIAYVLYTWSVVRQTDVGYWTSDSGHAGYIKYIYEHWFALPDFDPRDKWQFYHTPFFYYICAALIRIVSLFGAEFEAAAEVSQIVTLFSAMSIVITSYRLFRLFGLKDWGLTVAAAVITLSNTMIIMSGSISNDITAAALQLGAFYCAVRWYGTRRMSDIIKSALCIGFGLMTKLSAWMAAPPIAFIFIAALVGLVKMKKPLGACIAQFSAFLGVSVPLGMWFPVYNNIRWGVPFGYIPEGGESMYIGEHDVWTRLFTVTKESLSTPFLLVKYYTYEYNPIVMLLKSSADLQRFANYTIMAPLMTVTIILTAVIAAASVVCMALSLVMKRKADKTAKTKDRVRFFDDIRIFDIAAVILWLVTIVSYVVFCIKYPYTCTECVRYVIPAVTLTALYFGRAAGADFKNAVIVRIKGYIAGGICSLYGIVFMVTFLLLAFD